MKKIQVSVLFAVSCSVLAGCSNSLPAEVATGAVAQDDPSLSASEISAMSGSWIGDADKKEFPGHRISISLKSPRRVVEVNTWQVGAQGDAEVPYPTTCRLRETYTNFAIVRGGYNGAAYTVQANEATTQELVPSKGNDAACAAYLARKRFASNIISFSLDEQGMLKTSSGGFKRLPAPSDTGCIDLSGVYASHNDFNAKQVLTWKQPSCSGATITIDPMVSEPAATTAAAALSKTELSINGGLLQQVSATDALFVFEGARWSTGTLVFTHAETRRNDGASSSVTTSYSRDEVGDLVVEKVTRDFSGAVTDHAISHKFLLY
jgi:hypothetical protein